MEPISIQNPFPGAGCFLVRETDSTMNEARHLAHLGFPSGTAVAADIQSAGRGRFAERLWESAPGENLLATILLAPEYALQPGFTLRVGLALCRSLGLFCLQQGVERAERPSLKWPNDVLMGGKKISGILCESAAEGLLVGVGLNVNQRSFSPALAQRATSLALSLGAREELDRWRLLELLLGQLRIALEEEEWRGEAESFLWRRGESVRFLVGLPEREEIVEGILEGIAPSGALLLHPEGKNRAEEYLSGELLPPELPRVDRSGAFHIR